MFYWFVESQTDPRNDPVVLWVVFSTLFPYFITQNKLVDRRTWFVSQIFKQIDDFLKINLSEGCSGMLALFTESGPFSLNSSGTGLIENNFSWNKYANIIYIESPLGVGFSGNDNNNYTTGDPDTANQNYAFVKGFFSLFPEFRKNKFFISGESYGGRKTSYDSYIFKL